ncbi:MAG: class I SAM-dependent methyltransferase [Planctomycetota bacterium]
MRNQAVVDLLAARLPKGRIVDVGAGSGALAHMLQQRGYDVQALDIAPEHCEYDDVHVRQCDVVQGLPCEDGALDALTCTEVIEHLEDPFKAVREFNRVLKPGGLLVLTTPNYSHIFSRLHFLFTGAIPKPRRFGLEPPRGGRAHGHIQPMTWQQLKHILATSGFELRHFTTSYRRRGGCLLLPLTLLIWGYPHVLWSAERRARYHAAEQRRLLVGGRSLITISHKGIALGSRDGGRRAARGPRAG